MDDHSKKILAVKQLLKERDDARMNSDFERSDFLREKLTSEYGVAVIDQKGGPSGWKFTDGSTTKLKPGISIPPPDVGSTTEAKKRKVDSTVETVQASSKKLKKDKPDARSPAAKPVTSPNPASAAVSGEQKRNAEVLKSLLGPSSSSSSSSTVQGVLIEDTKRGSGPVAGLGNRVAVNYVGKLKSNGKVFDASKKKPFIFRLGRGEVIKGWDIGVAGMAVGGTRRLTIPPEKAYGRQGSPPVIPPNAALVFDVTLCKIL